MLRLVTVGIRFLLTLTGVASVVYSSQAMMMQWVLGAATLVVVAGCVDHVSVIPLEGIGGGSGGSTGGSGASGGVSAIVTGVDPVLMVVTTRGVECSEPYAFIPPQCENWTVKIQMPASLLVPGSTPLGQPDVFSELAQGGPIEGAPDECWVQWGSLTSAVLTIKILEVNPATVVVQFEVLAADPSFAPFDGTYTAKRCPEQGAGG